MVEIILLVVLLVLTILVSLFMAVIALVETRNLKVKLAILSKKVDDFSSRTQTPLPSKAADIPESDAFETHDYKNGRPSEDFGEIIAPLSESPDFFSKPALAVVPISNQGDAGSLSSEKNPWKMPGSDAKPHETSPLQVKTEPLKTSHTDSPALANRIVSHMKKNWLIWTGGLALVFGIGYLGQFIGRRVEIPPWLRIVLTSLLSLFFVGIGEWLHRQIQKKRWELVAIPNKNYIPATFVSAGMAGLYLSIVFATVSYQLFSPMLALSLIAMTAFVCLFLSRRFGSLMAILGLIGGYTAPIWVGEGPPNPYEFMAYISVVTAAGLYTQQRIKMAWLPLFISLGHAAWLGVVSSLVKKEDMAQWVLIFYPLAIYLLVAVPHQGWTLRNWHRNKALWPWYHPAGAAALIGFLFILTEPRLVLDRFTPFILMFVPLFMLFLPAIRRGYSSRESQIVSIVATVLFASLFQSYLLNGEASILVGLALIGLWTVLLVLRAYWQFLASYRSFVSYWWSVSCGAVMMIPTLLLTDSHFHQYFNIVSIASIIVCMGLAWLAFRESRLRTDLTAAIHAVLLVLNWLWFENAVFTSLLAVQIAVMTVQTIYHRPLLREVVIKSAVSLLLVRISLLPFIESWQGGISPAGWMAPANCLPAIFVLTYALKKIREKKMPLADWFEGALIHVIALFVLLQCHYWLTGSFIIFEQINFTGICFWLIESLTFVGIYSYRQQFSRSMRPFYQVYCYALLLIAALCILQLNTRFMPLLFETIPASAMPIFNGLALGWLVPGLGLLFLARKGLLPTHIPVRWIDWIAGGLLTLWALMSIRQFWQSETMLITAKTGMAEWLTYSVALILAGVLWTFIGVIRHNPKHQTYGLAVIGLAVIKVFLSDMGYLDGLWRAASFLGLGLALIGLGWLFQTLKLKTKRIGSEDKVRG